MTLIPLRGKHLQPGSLLNENPGSTLSANQQLEPKASNQMIEPEVLAKRDSAVEWCRHASNHAASYGGTPWRYALIPHDAIAENMTLVGLLRKFGDTEVG